MTWDPARYAHFKEERLRPGRELIARIALDAPRRIADLGCGGGELTAELARRWPHASIEAIDGSDEMLAQARARDSRIAWRRADIARWTALEPVDLVFSNAALHWLPDHEALFPRLIGSLREGGTLAVQMPRNDGSPARSAVREAVKAGPWQMKLAPVWRESPVAQPEDYLALLAPLCRALDVWESVYYHRLEGENPVADWLAGAALEPLLAALDPPERAAFEGECAARLAAAYPRAPDGRTIFPFRRLFILAAR